MGLDVLEVRIDSILGANMDIVEQWLSVSPDGGSGSFEASAILAALIVIGVLVFRGRFQGAWTKRIGNVAWPK